MLKKQKGMVTIMLVGVIAVGLFGFDQVMQYSKAKVLDRELDNYARTVAQVALRSELAITKAGIDAGTMSADQTNTVVNELLSKVNMVVQAGEGETANLNKKITFGKLDANDNFIPLESDASNPKGAEVPPEFSAVAVQLWSTDSFYNYTPQGRAIYGLGNENENDQGCYCKNRYTACLDVDLTEAELSPIASADALQIMVKGSTARENYCRYGYAPSSPASVAQSKYPLAMFDDGWIGRTPEEVNFFMFYTQGYDDAAFSRILEHKPLNIVDGLDPLYQTGGFMAGMQTMMSNMFGSFFGGASCNSSGDKNGCEKDQSTLTKSEISPSSSQSSYRCDRGFIGVSNCDASGFGSSNWKTLLNDAFYIGYEGTCNSQTSAKASLRCLSYNDSGTERFESCLEIERRSSLQMNFFERMMAFFLGPILNWERAYEGLDCEVKKMRYVGWLFWGGWQEV